jgi:viroplasmin and RNaseH domain-containing protein
MKVKRKYQNAKALINSEKTQFIFYYRRKNQIIVSGSHTLEVPNNRIPRVIALTKDDSRIKAEIADEDIKIRFSPTEDREFENNTYLVNYITNQKSILEVYKPVKKISKSALLIHKQKNFTNEGLKVFYTPLDTGVCLAATDPAVKVLMLPYTMNSNVGQTDGDSMITFNNNIRELWAEINLKITIHQNVVKLSLDDNVIQNLVKNTIQTEIEPAELELYDIKDIPVMLRFRRFHDSELIVEVTHILRDELELLQT